MLNTMALKDRITKSRTHAGMTKAELARRVGVTRATVTLWEDGTTKSIDGENLTRAAEAMGVSPHWLATGEGEENVSHHLKEELSPYGNPFGQEIRGKVPLISFTRAGSWTEAVDPYQPGHAEEYVDTTVAVRRHTFALRVDGDSMEPDFPQGTILVVEPEMEAMPGDYVVAKNGDDATFKQLVKDGPDYYLKPLNPRYPIKPLPKGAHICGVVREAIRKYR